MKLFQSRNMFRRRQRAADPDRYYGNGGTIYNTGILDIEVHNGKVVSVWYRCQALPFKQCDVEDDRALEMQYQYDEPMPAITGIILARD